MLCVASPFYELPLQAYTQRGTRIMLCALQQSKQVQREVTITAFHEEQNKKIQTSTPET